MRHCWRMGYNTSWGCSWYGRPRSKHYPGRKES